MQYFLRLRKIEQDLFKLRYNSQLDWTGVGPVHPSGGRVDVVLDFIETDELPPLQFHASLGNIVVQFCGRPGVAGLLRSHVACEPPEVIVRLENHLGHRELLGSVVGIPEGNWLERAITEPTVRASTLVERAVAMLAGFPCNNTVPM